MQKGKRSLSCVHVRHKNVKEISRCSRSTWGTAKKSTKKRDARAKLLLCLSKPLLVLLPSRCRRRSCRLSLLHLSSPGALSLEFEPLKIIAEAF